MEEILQQISQRARQYLRDSSKQATAIHAQFLGNREVGLRQIAALLEMQIQSGGSITPLNPTPALPSKPVSAPIRVQLPAQPARPPALFEHHQMVEFATGSMAKCFGPEFAVFEGRRYPRIPNGDLLLMSRATEINGQRHQFGQPSSIVTEYDVPADAWYFKDNTYPYIPYSVWMEIALQPCGFLSAYLGTSLMFPDVDYYFRNLDGSSQLLSNMDLRDKTITCRAKLVSTIASGTTIIQKFEFALNCAGVRLFEGGSIFGFFPPETMANQAGLDAGKRIPPIFEQLGEGGLPGSWLNLANISRSKPAQLHQHLSGGHLDFLDAVFLAPRSPDRPTDYLYATRKNDPSYWFYPCHFYEDPVMPGSLGVEAILETIQAYALHNQLGASLNSAHFEHNPGQTMTWKYRGQILPTHQLMKIEVHIQQVIKDSAGIIIIANASLWADTMRIYEIKNATVRLSEA